MSFPLLPIKPQIDESLYDFTSNFRYSRLDELVGNKDMGVIMHCIKIKHPYICELCAKYGYEDLLKKAHQNGCGISVSTCIKAAKYDHLQCLKYAHENGGNLGCSCFVSCVYGNLECFRYALETGCVYDDLTQDLARRKGWL
jgi:hypothetical protein